MNGGIERSNSGEFVTFQSVPQVAKEALSPNLFNYSDSRSRDIWHSQHNLAQWIFVAFLLNLKNHLKSGQMNNSTYLFFSIHTIKIIKEKQFPAGKPQFPNNQFQFVFVLSRCNFCSQIYVCGLVAMILF